MHARVALEEKCIGFGIEEIIVIAQSGYERDPLGQPPFILEERRELSGAGRRKIARWEQIRAYLLGLGAQGKVAFQAVAPLLRIGAESFPSPCQGMGSPHFEYRFGLQLRSGERLPEIEQALHQAALVARRKSQ
jgi:hypothetical protein